MTASFGTSPLPSSATAEPSATSAAPAALAKKPRGRPRKDAAATEIASDGLHYTRKAAGSIFASNPIKAYGGNELSCYFCGKHRKPEERTRLKLGTKNQTVCLPTCEKNPFKKRMEREHQARLDEQAAKGKPAGT